MGIAFSSNSRELYPAWTGRFEVAAQINSVPALESVQLFPPIYSGIGQFSWMAVHHERR